MTALENMMVLFLLILGAAGFLCILAILADALERHLDKKDAQTRVHWL